ncbi:MAG TPA: penicillin-binding protein 1C [Gemmatimonadaceae bacterium]|nr:penicillin-binding protein 1C [Gemmatimonadaceae bacterium]
MKTRRILAFSLATPAVVAATCAAWLLWPLPADTLAPSRGPALVIEDRNGLPLRSTRAADGSRSEWTAYGDVDPDVINAFIAVEDRRFWDHSGVDVRALARATRDNLATGRVVSGASTITMQLARLVRPSERSFVGKVSQAFWALRLERHLSKQQILEQYLNRVHLGQATVGIGAATSLYFGTSPNAVSIGQAATLAGLAHAPSSDNPFTSPRRARARRAVALSRMLRLGYASGEDVARARSEPLVAARGTTPFLAPHFTTRVMAWADDDAAVAGTVRTSIDVALQAALEGEVRHTVDMMKDRGVRQAAAVVLDNTTGEVLAWVGSPNFWAELDGQTDMVVSPRQPGSTLKPFLYALALDRGYTAATVLPDIPRTYATATGPYQPRNYDRRFRGPTRAREALASSYNVPAVELAARLGTGSFLHTLQLAGFESLQRDAEYYGLGLALGNGDVSLIELANAYRALANGGEWRPWTWRADVAGRPATAWRETSRKVVTSVSSAIVLDILQDAGARVPGFGPVTPFDFPFPVAVKTGTSRHFTDNWAVATTRGFTVAVWAGNFDGRPMQGVSGITGAGPLLHRAVMAVAARVSPGALMTPAEAGAVALPVCRLSGLRATSGCAQLTEWFARGTEPAESDTWEVGSGVTLPAEYVAWARDGMRLAAATPDSATDSVAPRRSGFRILSPIDGDRYAIPSGIDPRYATISLRTNGAGSVRWSVDGASHAGARWALVPGRHVIRAVTETGESASAEIVVANPE